MVVRRLVPVVAAILLVAAACDTGTVLSGDDHDDGNHSDDHGDVTVGDDGAGVDVPGEGTDSVAPGDEGAVDGTDAPVEIGTCRSGRTWCAGECVDLVRDPDHCGGCETRCRYPFADGRCDGGACGVGDCWAGHWDVDGDEANGCEYVCGGGWPSPGESCNGFDDDCDGETDEDVAGEGDSCGTGEGACEPGTVACTDGARACEGGVAPAEETCNGLDDDCDGLTDDETGLERCGNGLDDDCDGLTDEMPDPGPEVCNACDDDGDGTTDEDLPPLVPCGSDEGECRSGRLVCVGGVEVCTGADGPIPETCNGLDDDCNGETDEGELCPGDMACLEGACARRCDPMIEFPCPGIDWVCDCRWWPDFPDGCFCVHPWW